ncbi:UdgX family uracil-DNA binding protein [Jannaschia ovalis]|uniref:Type-4 uracil-DNA glycosylase n=1 Tax=Jannaschia ovalis TaxID=3038773 RepID=A0ABY8LDR8_9RHOB|nr:UdgX family uracil-DNA binding protein [Jannaschia sp. GRR-S6-38]WGH79465.1 UdgX family uracil-DNA binding protein [Jannaschia sp. GRR-S6-38]
MYAPRLPRLGTEPAWRDAARRLAAVRPADIDWGWEDADAAFFADPLPEAPTDLTVPKAFPGLVRPLLSERSGRGFALAHALLHRLQAQRGLLSSRADSDVAEAQRIAKEIRRDIHKMHAFLRFREVDAPGPRRAFAAWFEPDHRIEEATADFFVNRFGDMDWRIVTPEVTVTYRDGALDLVATDSLRPEAEDPLEQLWTTYYSNIFNPARLKVDAMRAEMPKKYWRNLPEARAIPDLIAGARAATLKMQQAGPTQPAPQSLRRPARPEPEPAMPDTSPDLFGAPDLPTLAREVEGCTRCPLHAPATQVVFGEGPAAARVMIVGEQPGDREDIAGRPFVGPAGQLFDEVAQAAGLDRGDCYVTNAVKHFKFVQKGKRRIHQKPATSEVNACNWWLGQELRAVDPALVVAMGATALHALTGKGAGLLKRRGGVERTKDGRPVLVTVHPSYLLRLPDPEARARETEAFRRDLARIPDLLAA